MPNINLLRPRSGAYRHSRWHLAAIGLIAMSLTLLAYPLVGQVEYAVARTSLRQAASVISSIPQATPPVVLVAATAVPAKGIPILPAKVGKILRDQLRLPTIGVAMEVVEGRDAKASLRKGAWRLPGTSTPDHGGNTVLGGHRWLYRPPSSRTLYHLDKVKIGDPVEVDWKGQTYRYRVREIKVVTPEQVEILEATSDDILTIFTCTPLFSSAQRLVVIAERI